MCRVQKVLSGGIPEALDGIVDVDGIAVVLHRGDDGDSGEIGIGWLEQYASSASM